MLPRAKRLRAAACSPAQPRGPSAVRQGERLQGRKSRARFAQPVSQRAVRWYHGPRGQGSSPAGRPPSPGRPSRAARPARCPQAPLWQRSGRGAAALLRPRAARSRPAGAARRAEERRGGERRERRQPRAREGSAGSRCRPRLRTWAAARRPGAGPPPPRLAPCLAPGHPLLPARRRYRPRAPGRAAPPLAGTNGESPGSLTSGRRFKMATMEPLSRDQRARVR